MTGARRRVAAAALLALALAGAAAAQDLNWFRGRMRGPEPRFPSANSFDGYFNFCRGMFYSDRREAGGAALDGLALYRTGPLEVRIGDMGVLDALMRALSVPAGGRRRAQQAQE